MQPTNTDTVTSTSSEPVKAGRVMSGIREAADSTGVPFNYLLAQATQESGLNPHARNSRSSASGLFQFTASTWLDMVRRHGDEHGLSKQAAAIVKGADGKLNVEDSAAKKAILDLRKDPKLSSIMAAEFAKDNAQVLESRLGRPATASDLYLAHFLGASGAARVIEGMEDNPRHSARSLLPDAARANPDVFRKASTVAGLYKSVQARFKTALGENHAAANQPVLIARTDDKDTAPRPLPRPAQEIAKPEVVTAALAAVSSQSPTAKAVAAVVNATAPVASTASNSFASAIQPESPFFPAAIPPAPSLAEQGGKADNLSLRGMIQAMDSGKDV